MAEIEIPEGESELKPISFLEFIELLGRVQLYISEDRIDEADDRAMAACAELAAYAIEHMVEQDFEPESSMWEELPSG